MERLYVIAPALVLSALMLASFTYYSFLCITGRTPLIEGADRRKSTDFFGPFWVRFMYWLLGPFERLVVGRISPNAVTTASLVACAVAGAAIATNHMATAGWVYILAGLLDLLDGRLARATGQSSKSGAFLDSVLDRWGELLVFTGFAWFLRDTGWLAAVMLGIAGSMMVSYTRARGEALGVVIEGGMMQRAERIALISVGTLLTAFFDAAPGTADYGVTVIGVALLACGVTSTATAIGRLWRGWRILAEREAAGRSAAASDSSVRLRRELEARR